MPDTQDQHLSNINTDLSGISMSIPSQAVNMAKATDMLGPWAIHPETGYRLAKSYDSSTIVQHVQMNIESQGHKPQANSFIVQMDEPNGGVANVGVVEVEGTLSKRGFSGEESSSTAKLRARVRQMRRDPSIKGIVLNIDSPGGTIGGLQDLAVEINATAKEKTVVAFVDNMAASAAYWLASQANVVMASNETVSIGSIGVYILLFDESAAAEQQGIRPVLIRSNPDRDDNMKGLGAPGMEITEEFENFLRSRVQMIHESFADQVAVGRGISREQLREFENGKVFLAGELVSDKSPLIDEIGDFDRALSIIMSEQGARTVTPNRAQAQDPVLQQKENNMPESTPTPETNTDNDTAAQNTPEPSAEPKQDKAPHLTVASMKQRYPLATAAWMLAQLDNGHTQDEADAAYRTLLEERLTVAQQASADSRESEEAPKSNRKPVGAAAVAGGSTEDFDGDPAKVLQDRTDELVKSGTPRHQAWTKACSENEDARLAMIEQHNATFKRSR